MTERERIKAVRSAKKLTMEAFGARIGITKASVSRIESGVNNITDQVRKAICREFGVDYLWLTTGDGQMFSETDDDMVALIDRIMASENEFHKELFKTFARLDTEELLALERILDKFIAEHVRKDQTINEKVDDYRRELTEEKEAAEGSSASQTERVG